MSAGLAFFTLCFPSLFSIVDPLAAVPIFLALAGSEDVAAQRRTAIRATVTATVILSLFALLGTHIFKFFGITIPAFKMAGGVLLFTLALEMMRAKHSGARSTPEEQTEAQDKEDAGLIPLGVPLLSGPGAIATVMVWSSRAKLVHDKVALFASIAALSVVTLLILMFAPRLSRLFGKTGINIVTRIMGLILAATAAQFVIDGWREAFSAAAG
ncbi:MAG: MarC family protein [Polyangiaceae bacterium]